MKTIVATASVLDEARAAKTSAEMETALNKIEAAKGELVTQSEALRALLEDAIVSGGDLTKHQDAIAKCDKEAMTYEAALAAFSRRKDEMKKVEAAAELEETKQRVAQLRAEYAGHLKEMERGLTIVLAAHANVDRLRRSINSCNDTLAAAGAHRDIIRPRRVAAETLGEPVRHIMTSRFGRRADALLRKFMNAFRTGADERIWGTNRVLHGRPGETLGAASQFMAGAMTQKRQSS